MQKTSLGSSDSNVLANKRTPCLAGRQGAQENLLLSTLLSVDQGNHANDVLATGVLSIHFPSTRGGANVPVHGTIPVNDDGKR